MNNKYYVVIALFIILSNLSGAFFVDSVINLGFFSGNGPMLLGVIPFCLSFFLLNIYVNQYGLAYVRRLILSITSLRLILAICIFLIIQFNIAITNSAYLHMTSLALLAGAIASIVALNLTCHLFIVICNFTKGKYLWLRCIIATAIGELLYSIISNTIFLLNHSTLYDIWMLSIHNYTFKIIFEIITLPLTYLLIYVLSHKNEPIIKSNYHNN